MGWGESTPLSPPKLEKNALPQEPVLSCQGLTGIFLACLLHSERVVVGDRATVFRPRHHRRSVAS